MFCVKCGTKIPEEGNFCPNCGTEVKHSNNLVVETLPKESAKKKKTSVIIFAILAGVVLTVMIIMAVMLLTNRDEIVLKKENESAVQTDAVEEEAAMQISVETEETKFVNHIKTLNESDASLEKINVFEQNYEPEDRKSSYQWNPDLFYSLEDISPESYEDGLINGYIIEKKQLVLEAKIQMKCTQRKNRI